MLPPINYILLSLPWWKILLINLNSESHSSPSWFFPPQYPFKVNLLLNRLMSHCILYYHPVCHVTPEMHIAVIMIGTHLTDMPRLHVFQFVWWCIKILSMCIFLNEILGGNVTLQLQILLPSNPRMYKVIMGGKYACYYIPLILLSCQNEQFVARWDNLLFIFGGIVTPATPHLPMSRYYQIIVLGEIKTSWAGC